MIVLFMEWKKTGMMELKFVLIFLKEFIFRNQRFHQIAKTNQENIRRLISNEGYQLNSDSNEDKQLIEEVLSKTKNTFNGNSSDDLGRTYQYLIDSLSSGANICLICIDIIQKTDTVRIRI